MRQKQCTRQQVARMRSAGALAVAGSVLAVGTLLSYGASEQEVLPAPPAQFKGQIGLSAKGSKSYFPQPMQAPNKGAPTSS